MGLVLLKRAERTRTKVEAAWRDRRDKEFADIDALAVASYATALVLANRFTVSHPILTTARRRLLILEDLVGTVRFQQYTAPVKGYQHDREQIIRRLLDEAFDEVSGEFEQRCKATREICEANAAPNKRTPKHIDACVRKSDVCRLYLEAKSKR